MHTHSAMQQNTSPLPSPLPILLCLLSLLRQPASQRAYAVRRAGLLVGTCLGQTHNFEILFYNETLNKIGTERRCSSTIFAMIISNALR